MHDIEPYYNWRHIYVSEEDEKSPFFQREYSEFEFSSTVYNYYIHTHKKIVCFGITISNRIEIMCNS